MSEEFGKLRKRAAERWGSYVVDGDELNRLLARLDTSESELSHLRARLETAERLLRQYTSSCGYCAVGPGPCDDCQETARFLAESLPAETWSKEPPKGGGWYWWIPEPEEAFQAIEVSGGKVCVDDELVPVAEAGGEWQGPIRPQ